TSGASHPIPQASYKHVRHSAPVTRAIASVSLAYFRVSNQRTPQRIVLLRLTPILRILSLPEESTGIKLKSPFSRLQDPEANPAPARITPRPRPYRAAEMCFARGPTKGSPPGSTFLRCCPSRSTNPDCSTRIQSTSVDGPIAPSVHE